MRNKKVFKNGNARLQIVKKSDGNVVIDCQNGRAERQGELLILISDDAETLLIVNAAAMMLVADEVANAYFYREMIFFEKENVWYTLQQGKVICLGQSFGCYFYGANIMSFFDGSRCFCQVIYESVFCNAKNSKQMIAKRTGENAYDVWEQGMFDASLLFPIKSDLLLVENKTEMFVLRYLMYKCIFMRVDLRYPSLIRRSERFFKTRNSCFGNRSAADRFCAPRSVADLCYDFWVVVRERFGFYYSKSLLY